MKKILLFSAILLFSFIACENDPTSPPVQSENPSVKIKSLKNNDAVYDSLYLDIEINGIENIVKVSILIDGQNVLDMFTPPFKTGFKLLYLQDNSDHNIYAKVYTNDETKTYTSDIIYFKFYKFRIGLLSLQNISNNSVKISWTNSISSLDHYVVESKKGEDNFIEIDQVSPSTTEYLFTNLDPNFNYYFRIKAIKDSIYSYSEQLKAKNVIADLEFFETVSEGSDSFTSIIFSKDSNYFYTSNYSFSQLVKWSTESRRVVSRINLSGYHYAPSITILEDKNILAVKTDYNIHLYDMANGQFLKLILFDNAEYYMKPIYIQETSKLYIYTKEYILCYDANDNFNCIDTIPANNIRSWITNVQQIVFCNNFNDIKVLDSQTNVIVKSTNVSTSYINNVDIRYETDEIVLTTYDYTGNIIILDRNTLQEIKRYQANNFESSSLDLFKNYCLGLGSSSICIYNTEIEVTTYTNFGNFHLNEIMVDAKRSLIIGTGVGEITAYKFGYRWVAASL